MNTSLLTQNSKIKKSLKRTFNFGIPAYKSKDGFITCPSAKDCIKGCYARQGAYVWSNVNQAFEKRLKVTQSNNFITIMGVEIAKKKPERIRIHDSGDFYSKAYFNKWLAIAKKHPKIEFYAYTKQVKMLKHVKLPSNFTLIFSYGGKHDHLINTAKHRHAKVFNSIESIPKNYINATDQDDLALTNNKRIALVYHGAKSKDWSN